MKCAIHQPQFLPWLGYLHKIRQVDKFVFLDNVQFKKNEFQNRNRVLVAGAAHWLTVPVSFHFGDTLRQVKIAGATPWRKKVMHTLELNYARAPHFGEFHEGLARVLEQEWANLAELNAASVRWLMQCFDIQTETFTNSQLPLNSSPKATTEKHWIPDQVGNDINTPHSVIPVTFLRPPKQATRRRETGIQNIGDFEIAGNDLSPAPSDGIAEQTPTQRLIEICRRVEADTYLSGAGGNKYLETAQFEKAGIKLEFQEFQHPVYAQHHSSQFTVHSSSSFAQRATEDKQFTEKGAAFVPCLSAIDGLFNCGGGPEGRKILGIEQ